MSGNITGRIHSTETFGAVDGPGVRFVVFMQGCPLRCIYCHNPDTWDFNGGTEITAEDLFGEISKYKNFIKSGGVTFSGGEPLAQSAFVEEVIGLCKKSGLHTAIDTSGCVPPEKCAGAVEKADMLLLDIKGCDGDSIKKITGSERCFPFRMLEYCEKIKKPVWIRHVLLPGYTTDEKKAAVLAEKLKKYQCVRKIELLPFHKIGEYKWEFTAREYILSDVEEPPPEVVERFNKIFTIGS